MSQHAIGWPYRKRAFPNLGPESTRYLRLAPTVWPMNAANPIIAAIVPSDVVAQSRQCMRCGTATEMRFYGCCPECTDALYLKFPGVGRAVEAEAYEPKMNVTPNAVAVKDD